MESARQVVDAYYDHLKQRDREKLLELLSSNIVVTYHSQPGQFPWSGEFKGIDGFDRFFDAIRQHLDVIEVKVTDSVVDRNKVVNLCRGVWEFKENGRRVTGSMVNVFTVDDGRITGYDVYADTAAFAEAMNS